MKEIKAKIFNKLVDEIRKVKDLEDQGYTIDGEKRITEGIAYWYKALSYCWKSEYLLQK